MSANIYIFQTDKLFKKICKSAILALIILFSSNSLFSQLVTTSPVTPAACVNNLVGNGIKISNITFTGDPDAKGLFDATKAPSLTLKSGIILSTGLVSNATGPNDDPLNGSPYWIDNLKSKDFGRVGDIDLEAVQGCNGCTNDASILEFDFIPESTPLTFRYVFASEEYPFYVCSNFNDVFAFFISGPKPGGGNYTKKNIAFIPGTTIPVAINSVNSGTPGWDPNCPCYWPSTQCTSLSYSGYFINNGDGSTPWANTAIQYNGFTTPFTATIDVIPCNTYHIKLAIADVIDGKYDSAVLIEENSFTSPSAGISKNYSNANVDTLALEGGCNDVQVCFSLNAPQATDLVIPLTYTGSTADLTGLDFPVLPNSITIPANQTKACFTISPIADGIAEGTEKVQINAGTSACGTTTTYVYINDYTLLKATPNPANVSICEGASTNISVTASNGITNKPYTYQWSNGAGTNSSATVSPVVTTTYTVTVQDACKYTATASVVVKVNPKPVIAPLKDTSICIGGSATFNPSGAGAGGSYVWNTGQKTPNLVVSPNTTTTYTITATTTFGCISSAKAVVKVNPLPNVTASALNNNICAGSSVEIDAFNATSYIWSSNPFDNSLTSQNTKQNPIVKPLQTTTYTVIGTDANKCSNTASVVVTVKSPPITGIKDTNICLGGTATLKVNVQGAGITYIWNTGETSPTITKSPAVSTTYTVTVTESTFGCQTIINAAVIVNNLPTANAGPDQSICQGIGTSFTATGGTIFNWSNGDKTATINVNPPATTTYTVTVSDAIGCSATDFAILTVNNNPTVDAGTDATICNGFSATLTANASSNVSYKWSNGASTGSITVNPSVNTLYIVTVTDPNGCKATDQVNVIVNANPVPVGQDEEICFGKNAILTISGAGAGGTYEWNTGDNTSSITVSPNTDTQYTVTLTNSFSCTATKTFNVTVHPNPVAVLPSDYSICTGNTTTITASGAGNNGSYLWNTGSNNAALTVTPLNTTTYKVTVTDQYTCVDSAKIIITVNNNPIADAGKDTSICFGFSANLTGKGGGSYLWSTGESTASIVVTPQTTTVYNLTVTDNNGCVGKGSVKVTVNPIPTSTFTITPSPICIKQITNITYTGTASAGATYSWNIDGDLTHTGQGPIQYSWNTTGNKTITLTVTENGCTSTETTNTIQVNDLPISNFSAASVSGCQPFTVTFINNSLQTNFSSTYVWDFGDGQTSTDENPVHTYTNSGKYTVTLKVSNAAVSCDDSKSVTDMIEVYPKPVARFNVQPGNTVSELNPTVFILSSSTGNIKSHKWSISDSNLTYADTSTIMHIFKKVGRFTVTLVVTNEYGCIDSTKGEILVKKDFTIYVPSAFIPSKCKETDNCQFLVKGTNISEFDIKIYNRWGGVVFMSQDIKKGWDGKVNGVNAESGTYPYIIVYRDVNRKQHSMTGTVTLLR